MGRIDKVFKYTVYKTFSTHWHTVSWLQSQQNQDFVFKRFHRVQAQQKNLKIARRIWIVLSKLCSVTQSFYEFATLVHIIVQI